MEDIKWKRIRPGHHRAEAEGHTLEVIKGGEGWWQSKVDGEFVHGWNDYPTLKRAQRAATISLSKVVPSTIYVVLQPHSGTNETDFYRVVKYADWLRYLNGARLSPPDGENFTTLADAIVKRDELNRTTS